MELGMIGLGRMGANMTERLLRGGHQVVAYDQSSDAVKRTVALGASGTSSLGELAAKLHQPRIVWMMVPSGTPVDDTIEALIPLMGRGDIIIDGGNSNYKETMHRGSI